MEKKKFMVVIQVTEEGSEFKASGDMTAGMVKSMLGEIEVFKTRLISDLEKSLEQYKEGE